MSGEKEVKGAGILDGAWGVLLRAIPGVSALGSSVLASFVPWFGWLVYVGFIDGLNAPVLGTPATQTYQELAVEGVRQSIIMILRSPVLLVLVLSMLVLLALHASQDPSKSSAAKPQSENLHWRFQLPAYLHLAKRYYYQYYYHVTIAVLLFLYLLLASPIPGWLSTPAMVAIAVSIPLYAFRHGYDKDDNRKAVTYIVLLLILAAALVTYPYRFGRAAYSPALVLLVEDKVEPSRLHMRVEPPGFNFTIACQQGNWLVEFAEKADVSVVRKKSYKKLADLDWRCDGDRIVPARQYTVPTSP